MISRIDQIQDLLKENPADSFLKHALALEYIKSGDDKSARLVFEELLTANPAYLGSYYHLAQLLERQELEQEAILVYEKGMEIAKEQNDQHAYSELRSAYDNLIY